MICSKTFDFEVAAYTETLEDVISGMEGLTRRITEIWAEQNAGLDVRGYLNLQRIVDVATEPEQADVLAIPVDCVVGVGSTFKIGHYNSTSGALTKHLVVFYEET